MSDPTRHSTTDRWMLGLFLSVVTMTAWATLPIALTVALTSLDPWTLTWFRFLMAALVVGAWVGRKDLLGTVRRRPPRVWILLLVAALTLTGNYMLYLLGLGLTTPAVAQVLIQLAPVLMALGGIWFFGERYSRAQWAGFLTLVVGLGVFFHQQLEGFAADVDRLWHGALLIALAGVTWACYALAQKQLLTDLSSPRIMLFIYVFAAVVLFPASRPMAFRNLDAAACAIVAYCALNTLIAYGSFAEALNHWEASRVSAVLALTPLGTFALAALSVRLYPGLLPTEHLDWLSLGGAGLVVAGSIVTSLGGRSRSHELRA